MNTNFAQLRSVHSPVAAVASEESFAHQQNHSPTFVLLSVEKQFKY